jgi:hypothetical protein
MVKVYLSIAWRSVAVGASCVAIALAAVLAVVTVKNDIDFLSALALALAVIAFVVQIIVFIAQTTASGQQLARAEELHGATIRALAAIEEKAEGTRQTVNTINDKVLGAVLGKVVTEAARAGLSVQSPQVTRRFADLVSAQEGNHHHLAGQGPRRRRQEPASELATLPTPTMHEAETLDQVLRGLSVEALRDLEALGGDYEKYGDALSDDVGHGLAYVGDRDGLLRRGLIVRTETPWTDDAVYVLTEPGKKAAALLLKTNLPEAIQPLALPARLRLQRAEQERAASLMEPAPEFEGSQASF